MLVLTRKLEESILIGDNISVKVISIENGIVKLGIDAPKDITIVRNELLDDVRELNIKASKCVDTTKIDMLSKLIGK